MRWLDYFDLFMQWKYIKMQSKLIIFPDVDCTVQ